MRLTVEAATLAPRRSHLLVMLLAFTVAQVLASSPPPPVPDPAAPARHRGAIEFTSQLSVGGGARTTDANHDLEAVFSLALRVDGLALRRGVRDFGLGAFVSTRTDNFSDVATALGASVLLPVSEAFPIVVSAGGVARYGATGWSGGALERVWWGARSFNYASAYVLSAGLFVEARQFFDRDSTLDAVVGVDADLQLFAIPVMALYKWWFRGSPSHETPAPPSS